MSKISQEELDKLCLKVGKHGLMLAIDLLDYIKESDFTERERLAKQISSNVDIIVDVFNSPATQGESFNELNLNDQKIKKYFFYELEKNKGHLSWWLTHIEYFLTHKNPDFPNVDLSDYYKQQFELNEKLDLACVIGNLYSSHYEFKDDLDDQIKYLVIPRLLYAIPIFCGSNFDLDHLLDTIDNHTKDLYMLGDFKKLSLALNGYNGETPLVNIKPIIDSMKIVVFALSEKVLSRKLFYGQVLSFFETFSILSLLLSTDKIIEIIKETKASLIYIYDISSDLYKGLLATSPQSLGALINSSSELKTIDENSMFNLCINQAYMTVKSSEERFEPLEFLKLIIERTEIICLEKNSLYALKLLEILQLKLNEEEIKFLCQYFDEKNADETETNDGMIEMECINSGYFIEMDESEKKEEISRVKQMCFSLLQNLNSDESEVRVPRLINPNAEE